MSHIRTDIGKKALQGAHQQNNERGRTEKYLPLGATTGACVPRSTLDLPVKLLIKDLQLLLGFGQWQSPLNGFCELQAVPSADTGLGLVVITAPII